MIALELVIAGNSEWTPVRAEIEEEISRLSTVTVDLLAAHPTLDLEGLLGNEAELRIVDEADTRRFPGLVSEASLMGRLPRDLYWYRLRLRPKLAMLDLTRRSRVFATERPNSTILDIVRDVLGSVVGLPLGADYAKIGLNPAYYPILPMVLQYCESDLSFLQRSLEDHGIAYYFATGDGDERLVLVDENTQFPFIEGSTTKLAFRPRGGLLDKAPAIRGFQRQAALAPVEAALKERDYTRPTMVLQGDATRPGAGIGLFMASEEEGYADPVWGRMLATIRLQEQSWRRLAVTGSSDCVMLQAGRVVDVDGADQGLPDGRYLVVGVRHEAWSSAEGEGFLPLPRPAGAGYENSFTLIPAAIPFRPERQTPVPVIAGMIRATVDGSDGVRPHLDTLGCYRVVFHFDDEARPAGRSSAPIRLMTPFGGPAEGMHFPLRVGTQVLLSFINGDPDRPVIVGALPDAVQMSMVTASNRTSNVIRTSSGIMVKMNDGLPSS